MCSSYNSLHFSKSNELCLRMKHCWESQLSIANDAMVDLYAYLKGTFVVRCENIFLHESGIKKTNLIILFSNIAGPINAHNAWRLVIV